MSESKAVILGCSGLTLTPEERAFFADQRPWGFILFARNVGDGDQLRRLCEDLRLCVENPQAAIFVDQEGGRVQRLRPPLAQTYPPAARIGEIFARDPHQGRRAAWLLGRLHAFDLTRYGINADCLPVLDIPVAGAHDVIGDRAYARSAEAVAELGAASAEGLLAGGVLPVMKHIPGHGRSTVDTHLSLPVVEASLDALRDQDFVPFKKLSNTAMAMTAHVIYAAIDPGRPATTSPIVIDMIIRGEIGFDGLLMSDDVSMKALSGDFSERARAIFAAGCDVVLHCNGVMDEMQAVCSAAPVLQGRSLDRAQKALAPLGRQDRSVETKVRDEFEALFEAVA